MSDHLTGQIVHLRPLTLDDVTSRYVAWLNDPRVNQYLESRFQVHTLASVGAFVQSVIARSDAKFFAICNVVSGRHVGNIKLAQISAPHRTANVGMLVGEPDAWNRGIATEAIRLATRFAFEELELRKLRAGCYAANGASIRAFQKCGYVADGILERDVTSGGEPMDVVNLARFR